MLFHGFKLKSSTMIAEQKRIERRAVEKSAQPTH